MSHNHKATNNPKLLIIHVGADKCASSSLQDSLEALDKSHPELQDYQFLKNNLLLKRDDPKEEEKRKYIKSIFKKRCSNTLIVSNEGLIGESLPSLGLLCKTAFDDYNFERAIITMYTRSPASHAISSYHQWFFRDKKILESDIKAAQEIGLNSDLLAPLERRLIAVYSKKQYRNWNHVAKNINNQILEFNDRIKIVSKHIPTKEENYPLLSDFLESANVSDNYQHISLPDFEKRSNDRFSIELTHSLSILLCENAFSQMFAPGPHELNHFLMALSVAYKESQLTFDNNLNDTYTSYRQNLSILSSLLDELAREGTTKYCEEFNLEPELFFHPKTNELPPQIESIIKNTSKRDIHKIKAFNQSCIERSSRIYKKIVARVPWMKFARKVF